MKTNTQINERIEMLKVKIAFAQKGLDLCSQEFTEWLAGATDLNTLESRCTSDTMLTDIRLRHNVIDSYVSRIEELKWILKED